MLSHLWRRCLRWLDSVATVQTTYSPQIEEQIVSREHRLVHHPVTAEMAEADVVQGQRFTLTCFIGNHGTIMQIDTLRALLLTGMINLHGKVQSGLMPLALKKGNEAQVDTIITEVEQVTEKFLTEITTLLHDRGVINATTPFYYTAPLRKAS